MRYKKIALYVFILLSLIVVTGFTYRFINTPIPDLEPITLASKEQRDLYKRHGDEVHIFVWSRKASWPEGYYEIFIDKDQIQKFWNTWDL